jgi:hypothetical protein
MIFLYVHGSHFHPIITMESRAGKKRETVYHALAVEGVWSQVRILDEVVLVPAPTAAKN